MELEANMRTRKRTTFAFRNLRRGDAVALRFVTDIAPAKVVGATRTQAVVKLVRIGADGQADLRSNLGEFLLRFDPSVAVPDPATGRVQLGAWRVPGARAELHPLNGIAYNGFEPAAV